MWTPKVILAYVATILAASLSLGAMMLPPKGVIDTSVLIMAAQVLVFAATMVGVDLSVSQLKDLLQKKKENS